MSCACARVPVAQPIVDLHFCRCVHAVMHSLKQAFRGPLHNVQSIVIYSPFIDVCTCAYGTIYDWRPEMDG